MDIDSEQATVASDDDVSTTLGWSKPDTASAPSTVALLGALALMALALSQAAASDLPLYGTYRIWDLPVPPMVKLAYPVLALLLLAAA